MTAYYNEIDPYAAQWLRNLIAAGHIAPGDVDERSIEDVKPVELVGYTQCHFFAGIGVWSHALRSAGWADDRPVWTGSCPCQPFSAAGKGGGEADERHLWPAFFHLIQHAKPRDVPVFGEQVASKPGLAWLDLVHADLEGQGYAVGAIDLCAAGVGAPHIRQRSFFVADANGRDQHPQRESEVSSTHVRAESRREQPRSTGRSEPRQLADADGGNSGAEGLQRSGQHGQQQEDGGAARGVEHAASEQVGVSGRARKPRGSGVAMGDTNDAGSQGRRVSGATGKRNGGSKLAVGAAGSVDGVDNANGATAKREVSTRRDVHCSASATNGFWHPAEWLPCRDGKARPVEPGTFPLAHGATARVGRLRAYGNAINAEQARHFIEAAMRESCI
jgi:DNA (cytosine-5)-methyltransferase 1